VGGFALIYWVASQQAISLGGFGTAYLGTVTTGAGAGAAAQTLLLPPSKELGIFAEVTILVKPQSCNHRFVEPVGDLWPTSKVHIHERPLRSVSIWTRRNPSPGLTEPLRVVE